MPSKTVKVPRLWVDETVVEIDDEGRVSLDGRFIGIVKKGHRMYSPPVSKGSRIVRYHKQVAEWHGWNADSQPWSSPDHRDDTRQRVLQKMVRDA